ncbi:hypothetical protein PR001_g14571 [Phytophthora rubi]|uniref:Uncharacterized protein n=1 Tax=Phytophthora rubi TaxID=129364 RepID=A0A6A3LKS9_9STRA|nr:hypothetical protein PR001_g14571 [Phytophthora rubi]
MRCRERGSRLAEAHAELDDLLANVAELHEEEETHQKKKKKLRDKRKEDDERAETMAWDEASRSLEERKVANEEARLTIDRARPEQGERKALIDLLHCITVKLLPQ